MPEWIAEKNIQFGFGRQRCHVLYSANLMVKNCVNFTCESILTRVYKGGQEKQEQS